MMRALFVLQTLNQHSSKQRTKDTYAEKIKMSLRIQQLKAAQFWLRSVYSGHDRIVMLSFLFMTALLCLCKNVTAPFTVFFLF